jgi:hypothetical protein
LNHCFSPNESQSSSGGGAPGSICASGEEKLEQGASMGLGKKYQPEQVVNLLRQIEGAVANGKSTDQACREAGIVELTY